MGIQTAAAWAYFIPYFIYYFYFFPVLLIFLPLRWSPVPACVKFKSLTRVRSNQNNFTRLREVMELGPVLIAKLNRLIMTSLRDAGDDLNITEP